MKFILVCLSLLLSTAAMAQVSRLKTPQPVAESTLQLFPLGMEMRYERNNDQELATHGFLNFAFAYQRNNLSALFEYSKYSEDSGNATTSIDHSHQEMILWGRWHFLRSKKEFMPLQFSIYGGLGVGTYQDEVKTTLLGTSQTDKSGNKVLSGLAVGGDIAYGFTKDFGVMAALEGRTLFAGDYDPNPVFSGLARLGIFFSLN
ncbi:hypothetical protein [Bdellovibrio svalbardensis]|uniref:Outer membrane protein beta-barrel domain-containing protein n=1 Tax=Bdellovibrio svalbardensis TaxID=2972972 RepID=A0ABT6DEZ0_9BACT|nr:hypothetical protein [Bdellovibrio svalbardensis]MDG0815407.1 hypothetical protein [Bdellovibrio svalbardensis]